MPSGTRQRAGIFTREGKRKERNDRVTISNGRRMTYLAASICFFDIAVWLLRVKVAIDARHEDI